MNQRQWVAVFMASNMLLAAARVPPDIVGHTAKATPIAGGMGATNGVADHPAACDIPGADVAGHDSSCASQRDGGQGGEDEVNTLFQRQTVRAPMAVKTHTVGGRECEEENRVDGGIPDDCSIVPNNEAVLLSMHTNTSRQSGGDAPVQLAQESQQSSRGLFLIPFVAAGIIEVTGVIITAVAAKKLKEKMQHKPPNLGDEVVANPALANINFRNGVEPHPQPPFQPPDKDKHKDCFHEASKVKMTELRNKFPRMCNCLARATTSSSYVIRGDAVEAWTNYYTTYIFEHMVGAKVVKPILCFPASVEETLGWDGAHSVGCPSLSSDASRCSRSGCLYDQQGKKCNHMPRVPAPGRYKEEPKKGKCLKLDGTEPHLFNYMQQAECDVTCDAAITTCYGYSKTTSHNNCLLWMEGPLQGGGSRWDDDFDTTCFVKVPSHTSYYLGGIEVGSNHHGGNATIRWSDGGQCGVTDGIVKCRDAKETHVNLDENMWQQFFFQPCENVKDAGWCTVLGSRSRKWFGVPQCSWDCDKGCSPRWRYPVIEEPRHASWSTQDKDMVNAIITDAVQPYKIFKYLVDPTLRKRAFDEWPGSSLIGALDKLSDEAATMGWSAKQFILSLTALLQGLFPGGVDDPDEDCKEECCNRDCDGVVCEIRDKLATVSGVTSEKNLWNALHPYLPNPFEAGGGQATKGFSGFSVGWTQALFDFAKHVLSYVRNVFSKDPRVKGGSSLMDVLRKEAAKRVADIAKSYFRCPGKDKDASMIDALVETRARAALQRRAEEAETIQVQRGTGSLKVKGDEILGHVGDRILMQVWWECTEFGDNCQKPKEVQKPIQQLFMNEGSTWDMKHVCQKTSYFYRASGSNSGGLQNTWTPLVGVVPRGLAKFPHDPLNGQDPFAFKWLLGLPGFPPDFHPYGRFGTFNTAKMPFFNPFELMAVSYALSGAGSNPPLNTAGWGHGSWLEGKAELEKKDFEYYLHGSPVKVKVTGKDIFGEAYPAEVAKKRDFGKYAYNLETWPQDLPAEYDNKKKGLIGHDSKFGQIGQWIGRRDLGYKDMKVNTVLKRVFVNIKLLFPLDMVSYENYLQYWRDFYREMGGKKPPNR